MLESVLPVDALRKQTSSARTVVAWLPALNDVPIASSPLIAEPPAEIAAAALAPWLVTARPLTIAEILEFVSACASARLLAPGVLVSPDLAFWGEVLRFGASLVAREQVLPSIEAIRPPVDAIRLPPPLPLRRAGKPGPTAPGARRRKPGRPPADTPGGGVIWRARWIPVIAADDARRFHGLVGRMPDACRAIAGDTNCTAPPALDRESLVRAFLGDAVDALVRGSTPPLEAAVPPAVLRTRGATAQFASLHEQWLSALRSPDGVMAGDGDQLAQLADQIRDWQRPVTLAEAAPFRVAFRLEEPAFAPSVATGASAGQAPRAPSVATGASAGQAEEATDYPWRVQYLLQSVSDPSLIVPASDVWSGTRLATSILQKGPRANRAPGGFDARAYVLRALGQAASLAPPIDRSLRTAQPGGFETDTEGAYQFLTETAWTLQQAGYAVMLPAWWTRKGSRARLALRAHVKDSTKAPSGLSLDTLLAVDWEAALGDQPLSLGEIEALARFKAPLVRLRGQWVQVSADDRRRALEFLERQPSARLTAGELMRLALGASHEGGPPAGIEFAGVDAEGWFRDVLAQLDNHAAMQDLPAPAGFRGTLRPYQARGYSWLAFLRSWGLGACLADDMGLGKTIQALALVQRDWSTNGRKPVLLLCPTSVVGNWQKEAARFTPELPVLVHHGHARAKDEAFAAQAASHALVISSYALLHRDLELFKKVAWGGVVLDEAQNIKNPETKQARAARAIEAAYRVALTGTPVENNVGDLWSIMEFLNPGFLGRLSTFRERFLLPIQTGTDPSAADRLKRLTGPFVLRRMKTDRTIIADLPEKQEMKVFCTLTREQASLYAAVVKDAERELNRTEGIKRKGVVLATLSKLKQVCNHPAQFLGDGSPLAGRSGKLARLTEMLEEIAATGERALVFSQFAEMGELLKRHLEAAFGREALFLHGGVPKAQRDRMVDRFQAREGDAFVFVLSLKAGGTGLNLTAANHVFLFDRWWNPAVENQAIDRTFRIGQTRDVQVHKFLCAGTLEERIDEMLERKLGVASRVLGTGEGWLTEMSTAELREIFRLRQDAVAE